MSIEQWTLTDAQGMKNVRFIYFACNAAWTWDAITSISDEVNMFKGRRMTLVDVVYVLSKFLTWLAIYATFPFIVLPLDDCNAVVRIIGWLGGISGSLTTLLFLFRVKSVYYHSVPAQVYFICLWILAAVGHLVFPLSLSSQPVQPEMLCVVESIKKFGVVCPFAVAIFDWTAFWCISLRVVQIYTPQTRWWEKCKIFITGAGTSSVPKVLLRTGHFYILPLLCLHICVLWADFLPIFGTLESYQYQAISVFATILAMNSMACRIFRLLRELDADEGTLQVVQISTIRFVGTPLKSPIAGSY